MDYTSVSAGVARDDLKHGRPRPQPMGYQRIVEDIVGELPPDRHRDGDVASYIPELARVPADRLGLAVRTIDGSTACAGDCDTPFSTQSMTKVLALAFTLTQEEHAVWERIGVEPSGNAFNSLVQLETENGKPRNPLINAGALVMCDIIVSQWQSPKQAFLAFVRAISADASIAYDDALAASELRTAERNRALAYFIKSFGNLHNDVEAVLELYVHICAVAMTCRQVVAAFSLLANDGHGVGPSGRILSRAQTRRINSLMLTCGFYDEAGEFAFHVGLPGKSGVGGGIVAICPGRFSAASWSPRLGPKGNSVLGKEALRRLACRTNASVI